MIIMFINVSHYAPYLGMGGRIYFGMRMTFRHAHDLLV